MLKSYHHLHSEDTDLFGDKIIRDLIDMALRGETFFMLLQSNLCQPFLMEKPSALSVH